MLRISKARPGAARLLVLALLLAAAAGATTIHGPADIASLTRASDAVVRAKVVSRSTHWAAGGAASGQLFTTIELAPSEQWKGEPSGLHVAIRTPGGELGELSQEVVGTPAFGEGEEVVVFLKLRAKAAPDHLAIYEVSHWTLGKFAVGQAASSGSASSAQPATQGNSKAGVTAGKSRPAAPAVAMRDRKGVDCIGCGPDEQDILPLDSLRAQVLAEVARAAKVKP